MVVTEIQFYEMLKTKLGAHEAEAFVTILENKVEKKFDDKKDTLVAEIELKIAESKVEIMRSIYLVGLIQFLAVVGSVLAIVNFMLK